MSGTTYDVVIRYLEQGNPGAKIGSLNQNAGRVAKEWEKVYASRTRAFAKSQHTAGKILDAELGGVGSMLSAGLGGAASAASSLVSSLQTAVVSLGAVAAVGLGAGLVKGIGINQELQDLKISLAATFQANYGIDPFTKALEKADGMMRNLRKDAANLPGTLEDLAGIFKSIAPNSGNLGLTPERTEAIAAKFMAAGKVSGLGAPVIGREAALILSGNAHANNVLSTRLGFDSKKMNAMSGDDRVKEVERVLAKYDNAIIAFGKSFSGVSTTFTDNLRNMLAAGTAAPFQKLTDVLATINEWYNANRDELLQGVEQWGNAFVGFIEIAAAKLAPIKDMFFQMEKHFDRGQAKKAAVLGIEALGAVSIASALAPIVAKWAGTVGGAAGAIGKASGIPGVGPLAELGATLEAGALSAGLLTLAVVTLAGAFHSVLDSGSQFHRIALSHFNELWARGSFIFGDFIRIFDNLQGPAWAVADYLGTNLIVALDTLAIRAQPATNALRAFTDEMSRLYYAMLPMGNGLVGKGARGELIGATGGFNEVEMAPKVVNHNTTINGGVHMHVEGKQEDPNRIAHLVINRFREFAETPTKSSRSGQWSSAVRAPNQGGVDGYSSGSSPENVGGSR